MKIIAWNINGIRSLLKTEHLDNLIKDEDPDIFCMGEIRVSCPYDDKPLLVRLPKYKYRFWSPCTTKGGYSGTAIFSKKKPVNMALGLDYNGKNIDDEGRVITLEFKKFFLIHVYTPNSGQELARLNYRVNQWDIAFCEYINKLQKTKPVIVCGDLNVANEPIDIKNPTANRRTAGYTQEERDSFKNILKKCNLVDSFRFLHDSVKYSYWSYRGNARKNNAGWRIDYFLNSENIQNKITECDILDNVLGSDHAPIKQVLTI